MTLSGGKPVSLTTLSVEEFVRLPTRDIHDILETKQLSISLLLNGTRRWYISQYFDDPPKDNSYFPAYLEAVLTHLASLLEMLADHGLQRIFVPVYSEGQQNRDSTAFKFLLKGIIALAQHPLLLETYQNSRLAVRFYGDTTALRQHLNDDLFLPLAPFDGQARANVYYDVNTGNPYDYLVRLIYEYGLEHGRPPEMEDLLELYYGDRNLKKLNILVAFNRIYSRIGIPHLLEGNDRIYLSVVTPLVLSQNALRRILYDYLFNDQDVSRNYMNIHDLEIKRLKRFYAANAETIVGLTKKYEDFCYPLPGATWPAEMDQPVEP
jgi:hypothetical protein